MISIGLIFIVFLVKTLYGIATAPPLGAHFPQRIKIPNTHLDSLVEGELMLDNGCLRVDGVKNLLTGNSILLIWDPRFSTRIENEVVQVIDSDTGEVFASVGDYVKVGGGNLSKGVWLKLPIPTECPGPYWSVGDPPKKIERP